MTLRLRVESPGVPPFEREIDASDLVIGRSATSGLVVPDSGVSRQHVRLFQREAAWWIEDLGARNGTKLNERVITGAMMLHPGNRIGIGGTVLRLAAIDGQKASVFDTAPPAATDPRAEDARQAARLRTLNEIHRALATPISLSDLLDLILERCFSLLNPEEGVILLRGKDGQMRQAATRRISNEPGDVFVSRRIIDEVAGKGTPALVLDTAIDERFATSESIMVSGVKSVLAAPLVDAHGTIGLIALCSRASLRQFAAPDLDMLVSLASAAGLRVRNTALMEEAAERRVLEHELSLAHDMQMAMLPRHLPERAEVEVAASLTPARSVGGDLYDFVLDRDRLWFIVGDVSGKGVGAALYMAVAKTLFRATVQAGIEVADVVGRMNRELCRDNDQMMFVTAVVGELDLQTGEAVLADAGHNPAVRVDARGRLTHVQLPKGVALGVVDEFEFVHESVRLDPGDILVLYTDGATDARCPRGDQLGCVRLDRIIEQTAGLPAESAVRVIVQAVEEFTGGATPEDDLTVLALRYRGA